MRRERDRGWRFALIAALVAAGAACSAAQQTPVPVRFQGVARQVLFVTSTINQFANNFPKNQLFWWGSSANAQVTLDSTTAHAARFRSAGLALRCACAACSVWRANAREQAQALDRGGFET